MKQSILFHITGILVLFSTTLYSDTFDNIGKKQSGAINSILTAEMDSRHLGNIAEIVNYIDRTYMDIPETLNKGGKLTIFFDPAHGKDGTGEWRGITTNRIGVTGKPEEYYSIHYSRKLYTLLKENSYFNIITSKDFQKVLDGKSDSYHFLKFSETVQMASDAGAFIIIAQHLNNVSIFNKADGRINIPGIHMARDNRNRLLLRNIKGSYSGFLTLYNKFDASGFSRQYAVNIRESLVGKGYKANNWEYGAVGDDRFIYYVDFPVSVIYENGFISHPEEEKKLLDPYYMDGIVKSQYDTLLQSLNEIYGVDISGSRLKINNVKFHERVELLKLARIAIYYIKNAETAKANKTVNAMAEYSRNKDLSDSIAYYQSILRTVNKAEEHYKKGAAKKKKKHHKSARRNFNKALASLDRNSLYSGYRAKYNNEIGRRSGSSSSTAAASTKPKPIKFKESSHPVVRSNITKPVILTMEDGTTLQQAIIDALNPDDKNLMKIHTSLNNYKKVKWVKYRKWSKKHKKNITAWKKVTEEFNFTNGIYIVKFDKIFNVIKAESVSQVYLNPEVYQNQQYLKNSYFEKTELERNI